MVAVPTCTGLDLLTISLSPNWPLVLSPHDHKVPSVLVAKALTPLPQLTRNQFVPVPTCVGLDLLILLFCPNTPANPEPHVHRVPSVLVAMDAPIELTFNRFQLVFAPTCVGLDL